MRRANRRSLELRYAEEHATPPNLRSRKRSARRVWSQARCRGQGTRVADHGKAAKAAQLARVSNGGQVNKWAIWRSSSQRYAWGPRRRRKDRRSTLEISRAPPERHLRWSPRGCARARTTWALTQFRRGTTLDAPRTRSAKRNSRERRRNVAETKTRIVTCAALRSPTAVRRVTNQRWRKN